MVRNDGGSRRRLSPTSWKYFRQNPSVAYEVSSGPVFSATNKRWAEIIQCTAQNTKSVEKRRWKWLRMWSSALPKRALHGTPQGKRKRCHSKETWRRAMKKELKENYLSLKTACREESSGPKPVGVSGGSLMRNRARRELSEWVLFPIFHLRHGEKGDARGAMGAWKGESTTSLGCNCFLFLFPRRPPHVHALDFPFPNILIRRSPYEEREDIPCLSYTMSPCCRLQVILWIEIVVHKYHCVRWHEV